MTYREALDSYRQEVGPKFARIVERYLEDGGDNHDQTFTRYLERMEKARMARGTVDLHRRTIRAFYRRFGMAAPNARGWHYDGETEARRPALDAQLVARLIGAAKAGGLTARQTTLLALSTTFGMRAEEMASVEAQDVDREGERIFIRTAKKGRRRWCWLPPEIQPYLQEEWPRATANGVEKAFSGIWGAVLEGERPPRTAWHSLRRSLVRDMERAGVSEQDRERFMRWRTRGGMAKLYAHPTITVSEQGEAPARQEGDEGSREYDEACWKKHPYLALWS